MAESVTDVTRYQVLVTGIGDASAALFSALKQAIKLPEPEIARRILQAPSVLASELNHETAKTVSDLLEESGLETQVIKTGELGSIELGNGDYELALSISSFKNIHEILAEVIRVTGLDATTAVQLLLKTPTVLLGNISLATAQQLEKRFSKTGIDVDISQPSKACFDLVLRAEVYSAQQNIEHFLQTHSLNFTSNSEHRGCKTYSVLGVTFKEASEIWNMAQEARIPCQLLNRDYQRYDIKLNTASRDHKLLLKTFLVSHLKIPERIVEKVIASAPVVIAKQKRFDETRRLLSELADLKCEANAELVSSLTFDIEMVELGDELAAKAVMEQILMMRSPAVSAALKGKIKRIEGPFSYNQVRWAQHEFIKINGQIKLIKRS